MRGAVDAKSGFVMDFPSRRCRNGELSMAGGGKIKRMSKGIETKSRVEMSRAEPKGDNAELRKGKDREEMNRAIKIKGSKSFHFAVTIKEAVRGGMCLSACMHFT